MNRKVLFVDDNENLLASMRRQLRNTFDVETAIDGPLALDLLSFQGPFAVIVSDMRMPGMDGIELLNKVKERAPDTVRIMLTGNQDQTTAVLAVNEGQIFRFLNKPCDAKDVALAVESGIRQYQLITAEKELLNETVKGLGKVLSDLLSIIDPKAFGLGMLLKSHIQEVVKQFNLIDAWDVELAALLAPIGMITLPEELRDKISSGEKLEQKEASLFEQHPHFGSELVSKIPRLDGVAKMILYQNKNFDGTGFPADEVSKDDIPLGSRIIRVLNQLTAAEAAGETWSSAINQMKEQKHLFDEEVLEAVEAGVVIPGLKELDSGIEIDTESEIVTDTADEEAPSPFEALIKDLKEGHIILKDIETTKGLMILPAGSKISGVNLARIKNYHAYLGLKEPIVVIERGETTNAK